MYLYFGTPKNKGGGGNWTKLATFYGTLFVIHLKCEALFCKRKLKKKNYVKIQCVFKKHSAKLFQAIFSIKKTNCAI